VIDPAKRVSSRNDSTPQPPSDLFVDRSIRILRELGLNTQAGVMSWIRYDKSDPDPPRRLVEPTTLVDGFSGTLLRTIQHEPEVGVRHFSPRQIVEVERAELPLSRAGNKFSSLDLSESSIAALLRAKSWRPLEERWFSEYYRRVWNSVLDTHITEFERRECDDIVREHGLDLSQIRTVHAAVFSDYLRGCVADGAVTPQDEEQIELVLSCLDELGWRPG